MKGIIAALAVLALTISGCAATDTGGQTRGAEYHDNLEPTWTP